MRNAKHPTISLIEYLKSLHDPRANRTKHHEFLDILMIGVCTLLCGGETCNDMEEFGQSKREWFETFLS